MIIKSLTNLNLLLNSRRYLTKLAFVSDLHLEHKQWQRDYPRINESSLKKLDDSVHGIAIVGDLSNPYYDNFTLFLAYCGSLFKNVYFVAGNHEYYSKGFCKYTIKETITKRIEFSIEQAKDISNNNSIFYLDNSHIQLPNNKIIIGSTLWSNHQQSLILSKNNYLTSMYEFINDEYYDSCNFLKQELKLCRLFNNMNNIKKPNITLLTHYLPTYQLIDKKYHPIYNTNRAKAERYFSNVEHFIKHPIKNWICGHSHSLTNIHLNGVNLCINPFVSQKSHLINLNFVNL
jgi:predicted phosphohydrolase